MAKSNYQEFMFETTNGKETFLEPYIAFSQKDIIYSGQHSSYNKCTYHNVQLTKKEYIDILSILKEGDIDYKVTHIGNAPEYEYIMYGVSDGSVIYGKENGKKVSIDSSCAAILAIFDANSKECIDIVSTTERTYNSTNQVGELKGIINTLQNTIDAIRDNNIDPTKVKLILCTDSMYSLLGAARHIRVIREESVNKNILLKKNTKVANHDLWVSYFDLYDKLSNMGVLITYQWVAAHTFKAPIRRSIKTNAEEFRTLLTPEWFSLEDNKVTLPGVSEEDHIKNNVNTISYLNEVCDYFAKTMLNIEYK